jgi:peptidoglycan/xylan/chitin deacetylase (PgdA/CDA1 family)
MPNEAIPLKSAYLTIDDGPSTDTKIKLDHLLSKNIPAICFFRGDHLKQFQECAIYAIKNNFIIGNHSYHHPLFSNISLNEARHEITKTDRLIEETYKKAGIKRPGKIFRFPYGDKGGENKNKIQGILSTLGYQQPPFQGVTYPWFKNKSLDVDLDSYWTYDFEEYRIDDVEQILDKMTALDAITKLPDLPSNEILLIHDHDKTRDAFFKITEKLSGMPLAFKLPVFY